MTIEIEAGASQDHFSIRRRVAYCFFGVIAGCKGAVGALPPRLSRTIVRTWPPGILPAWPSP